MTLKIIEKAQLSVNQLAEFIHSSDVRRRSIIKESKYPKDGGGFGKYRTAIVRDFIYDYICDRDMKHIKKARVAIKKRKVIADWHKSDNENCLELVDSLVETDLSMMDKYQLINNANKEKQTLDVSNLDISIYPRVLIKNNEGDVIGGIVTKLTQKKLKKTVREDVALMLRLYLESNFGSSIEADLCLSYDVISGEIISCPKAFKRRKGNIEAASATVVDLWAAM